MKLKPSNISLHVVPAKKSKICLEEQLSIPRSLYAKDNIAVARKIIPSTNRVLFRGIVNGRRGKFIRH